MDYNGAGRIALWGLEPLGPLAVVALEELGRTAFFHEDLDLTVARDQSHGRAKGTSRQGGPTLPAERVDTSNCQCYHSAIMR